MPMVSAWPVLPGDMLRPIDIVNKFRSRSLAGLGQDDTGVTEAPLSSTDLSSTAQLFASGDTMIMPDGSIVPITSSDTQVIGSSQTNLLPYGYNTLTVPAGVSATPSGTVNTSASDAATMAFVSQLLKQGMSLAQIATLQPGTVIQTGPGGTSTILRQSTAGQTPVPVSLVGGAVTASANQGASMAIIAVVAVLGVMLLSRR